MIDFFDHVRFTSPEWAVMKKWLEDQRAVYISKLINCSSHDESNEHRGAIKLIDKLLNAERAALTRAANQG
jgi:hypothetical protein